VKRVAEWSAASTVIHHPERGMMDDDHDEHACHWGVFDGNLLVAAARLCLHDEICEAPGGELKSMWKYPAAMDVDSIAANLHPNVRDDGGRTEPIVVRGPGADKADLFVNKGLRSPVASMNRLVVSRSHGGRGLASRLDEVRI
jgi:hypothetical protein